LTPLISSSTRNLTTAGRGTAVGLAEGVGLDVVAGVAGVCDTALSGDEGTGCVFCALTES